jgi:hypothetical protein
MMKKGIQVGYLKKVINIFEKKINITFAIETLFFNI